MKRMHDPSPTLSEAFEGYKQQRLMRDIAAPTRKNESFVIERFIANVGDQLVKDLTPEDVEDWFFSVRQPHKTRDGQTRPAVTNATANYYYARLKSFTSYLAARAYTRADLLSLVRPFKVERRQRLQPGVSQLMAMLSSAPNPRDRALLATAMNSGLRASELLRLRVGDVNLSELSLNVVVTKSRLTDTMPITRELATELRAWLTAYANSIPSPLTPDTFLFPRKIPGTYLWSTTPQGARVRLQGPSRWQPEEPMQHAERVAKAALKAIGIKDVRNEGIHTLRRAFARHLFDFYNRDRGYDGAIRIVSSALHHSNVSTTETYLGMSSERSTRDRTLRGQSFLPLMLPTQDNVVDLATAR
jgi:integrase